MGGVDVLVFVHEHVAIPAVELGADILVFLEDRDHVDEEVVEVDRGVLAQAALGDRLIELPLGLQNRAENVVGPCGVGLEPDRRAELGDGLV